jgi:heme oxygenase
VIAPAALHPGAFDAHTSLRVATHATHIRLHGLPQFQAISDGRLNRRQYAELLGSLHAFHTAIAAAADAGGLLHLSSSPLRQRLLADDLASLGASMPVGERPAWTAPSREALYGALYVAEGSALGGRVIARQLDYLFGDSPEGRTFFRGADDTGPRWRRFIAALAEFDEDALSQMVVGAEAGFALFERCLTT